MKMARSRAVQSALVFSAVADLQHSDSAAVRNQLFIFLINTLIITPIKILRIQKIKTKFLSALAPPPSVRKAGIYRMSLWARIFRLISARATENTKAFSSDRAAYTSTSFSCFSVKNKQEVSSGCTALKALWSQNWVKMSETKSSQIKTQRMEIHKIILFTVLCLVLSMGGAWLMLGEGLHKGGIATGHWSTDRFESQLVAGSEPAFCSSAVKDDLN